mgnify:CR=1 FL=1
MAERKYSIVLGGKIDAQTVKDSINALNESGKMPKVALKVSLQIDESEIKAFQEKLRGAFNVQVGYGASSATADGNSSGGSGVGSKIDIDALKEMKDLSSLQVTFDKTGEAISATATQLHNLNEQTTTYIDKSGEVTAYTEKTTTSQKENLQALKQSQTWYQKVSGRIQDLSDNNIIGAKTTEQFRSRLEEIGKIDDPEKQVSAFKRLNQEISDSKKQSMGFGKMLETAAQKFSVWSLVTVAWYKAVALLKDVVVQVKAMDDALVELNKVADLSDKQLDSLTARAFALADAVGQTGTEAINAITEVKRAGFSLEESELIAKYALMMTNVAEGIDDAGEAANILISVLKGTNAPISYASQLLDELNSISNQSAISFDALANMTQEIAGTMDTLGVSTQETMSLLTGAYEVLQDERVAKGISVIGLRISGLNESLEKEAGLQSTVNDALMKYAKISVFDEQTGQLRDYYDILDDLSRVWDSLSKNAQTYLTTQLAGKNRADVLTALMNNWQGVQEAMEQATDSEGSALHEQEGYLDSIEGHLKALQSAWQELANTSLNADMVKVVVDLGTGLVKAMNAMGGILNTSMLITGVIVTWKGFNMTARLSQLASSLGLVQAEMGATATVTNTATIAVNAFQASLGILLLVISAVTMAISLYNQAQEQQEQARQESIQKATEKIDKLKSEIEQTRNLQAELDKLKKKRDELNATEEKTADIRERIAELNDKIASQEGKLEGRDPTKSWNDLLEQYKNLVGSLAEENAKAENYLKERRVSSVADGSEIITRDRIPADVAEEISGWGGLVWRGTGSEGTSTHISSGTGTPEERLQRLKTIREILERNDQLSDELASKLSRSISNLQGEIESSKKSIEDYNKAVATMNFLSSDGSQAIEDLWSAYNKFEQSTDAEKVAMLESTGALRKNLDAVNKLKETYPEAAETIDSFLGEIEDKVKAFETDDALLNVVDRFTDVIAKEKEAYESLQETEKKELELQEKILAVEQARMKLAEAKNKQVLVYRRGRGMVFMQDLEETQKAEESLLTAESNLKKYQESGKFSAQTDLAQQIKDKYDKLSLQYGASTIRSWFNTMIGEYSGDLTEAKMRDLLNKMNAFTGFDDSTSSKTPFRPSGYRTDNWAGNNVKYDSPIGPPSPSQYLQQRYQDVQRGMYGRTYNIATVNVTADDVEEFARSLEEAARNGGN